MVNKLFEHIGFKIRQANPWINASAVNCVELPIGDGEKRIVNFEGAEKEDFSFDDTKGRAFYIKLNPKFQYQTQRWLTSSQKEYLVTITFRFMYFEIDAEQVRTKFKLENIFATNFRQMSFDDYKGVERSVKLDVFQTNSDAVTLFKEETAKDFDFGADALFIAVDARLSFLSTNDNCEEECGISTSENILQGIDFCDPAVIAGMTYEQKQCLEDEFGGGLKCEDLPNCDVIKDIHEAIEELGGTENVDVFAPDPGQITFELTNEPIAGTILQVLVNGLEVESFSLSGKFVTLAVSYPLTSDDLIKIIYFN